MINAFILEGKVKEISKPINGKDGKKYINVKLDVAKTNKNEEHDLITVCCFGGLAEIILESVKIGEILSVQGRIQSSGYDYSFIVEKASFLS